jgi:hypothetical protein
MKFGFGHYGYAAWLNFHWRRFWVGIVFALHQCLVGFSWQSTPNMRKDGQHTAIYLHLPFVSVCLEFFSVNYWAKPNVLEAILG